MRNWRPMTWVIVIVNVLFLIWLIGGVGATTDSCAGMTGAELDACEAGTAIGATIGAGIILFLWVFVDIILGIVWMVTKGSTRDCPTCGRRVKKGQTQCKACGHDFRQAQPVTG